MTIKKRNIKKIKKELEELAKIFFLPPLRKARKAKKKKPKRKPIQERRFTYAVSLKKLLQEAKRLGYKDLSNALVQVNHDWNPHMACYDDYHVLLRAKIA